MNELIAIEGALIKNDLSQLNPDQRLSYYKTVCESLGLNPLTQPFAYITLNGKLTLYAKRDATDQLRKVHKVSINITARETIGDVYVVTARARDGSGREDESTGAVAISGVKGEALANAYLKAETKAKRRVTLSLCGLGLLDESEVDSVPLEARRSIEQQAHPPERVIVEKSAGYIPSPNYTEPNELDTFLNKDEPFKPEEEKQTAYEELGFAPSKIPMDVDRDMRQELENYRIGFGKHKGRTLLQIGVKNTRDYATWLKNNQDPQKGTSPGAAEFFEMAKMYDYYLQETNQ